MNEESAINVSDLWASFCDNIKEAGIDILDSANQLDEVNQAEGLRYLARLMKVGIDKYIQFSDPLDPVLFKLSDERTAFGGANPDNIYLGSALSDQEVYKISGHRGSIWHFNFNIFKAETDGRYQLLAIKEGHEIECDSDGNFELILGGEPQKGNWIDLPPGTNQLILRQTYRDSSEEQALAVAIQRLTSDSKPAPLKLGAMVNKLKGTEEFFCKTGTLMHGWSKNFLNSMNTLPLTDPQFIAEGGGDPNAFFYLSSWKIQPGEALLVHVSEFPDDKLWNLALFNFWFETLDYINFRIHTNNHICDKNTDGSVTLVISDTDPGVKNWLNTSGHIQGNMAMRAWTEGIKIAQPQTELVQLDMVDWGAKFKKWS